MYEDRNRICGARVIGVFDSREQAGERALLRERDAESMYMLLEISVRNGLRTEIMNRLAISGNSHGMSCLRDALILASENEDCYEKISKLLYPELAARHKCSAVSVESSIRSAISSSWKNADLELRRVIFGESGKKGMRRPTNSVYIRHVVRYLQDPGNKETERPAFWDINLSMDGSVKERDGKKNIKE